MNGWDCTREKLNMAKKEKPQRRNQFSLIIAQNNAIRTNYINAKNGYNHKNKECRLSEERDWTVYHVISEYSKLT